MHLLNISPVCACTSGRPHVAQLSQTQPYRLFFGGFPGRQMVIWQKDNGKPSRGLWFIVRVHGQGYRAYALLKKSTNIQQVQFKALIKSHKLIYNPKFLLIKMQSKRIHCIYKLIWFREFFWTVHMQRHKSQFMHSWRGFGQNARDRTLESKI